jgi:hypothetical protein
MDVDAACSSQAFAEHIKFCANKLMLGVNFLPNTPNYDRVVEMQVRGKAGLACVAMVCFGLGRVKSYMNLMVCKNKQPKAGAAHSIAKSLGPWQADLVPACCG